MNPKSLKGMNANSKYYSLHEYLEIDVSGAAVFFLNDDNLCGNDPASNPDPDLSSGDSCEVNSTSVFLGRELLCPRFLLFDES